MDNLNEPFENGFFILLNKKKKTVAMVEYFDGDWYLPDGVKETKNMLKRWSVKELLFKRPAPVKDSDLHTVPKSKEKTEEEVENENDAPKRRGRIKTDAPTIEGRAKYLTEYKSIL